MKIRRVEVENLFDTYSYSIEFKEHDHISIIHAPNGYGKTTIFKMIKTIFDMDLKDILTIPFSSFLIEFTEDYRIAVKKNGEIEMSSRMMSKCGIIYSIYHGEKMMAELELPVTLWSYEHIDDISIEGIVRGLEMKRRHTALDNREKQPNYQKKFQKYKEAMDEIKDHISIHFIDANRLYTPSNDTDTVRMNDKERLFSNDVYVRDETGKVLRRRDFVASSNEKICIDAQDILHQISQVRQRYSLESEKADRDFPDRLVQFVESSDDVYPVYSDEEIAEKLKDLEEKRIELVKAGLALKGKKSLTPTKDINDTMRKFYTLYIDDTFKKLSLYDDIKNKLELFAEIINKETPFSNKIMRIDNERGIYFEPQNSLSENNREIPLQKLSSGEKNAFILFYELIFKSEANSVYLIDEPEISLHIAWQKKIINVLEKICQSNNMQAIVATHSPDIVDKRWDLLVSLDIEGEIE